MLGMTRNPLQFLTDTHARHGDFVLMSSLGRRTFSTTNPELIRDMFVTHGNSFGKGRGLRTAGRILGQGLLTANGPLHLRQRRLVQPAFLKQRLDGYARAMVSAAEQRMQGWQPGQCLDLASEMSAITLDVITRTMFGDTIGDDARTVESALNETFQRFQVGLLPLIPLLEKLPLAANRRFSEAKATLDAVLMRLIRQRRNSSENREDLLSLLLHAVDETDGTGMSDRQLRDEAMTIFLAGHETTANWLTWTLALLGQHPNWLARLCEEATARGSGSLGSEDAAALPLHRQVLQESLRLYPPAWLTGRAVHRPVTLGGESLHLEDVVLASQWVVHRLEKFFPAAGEFRPERWTPDFEKNLPRFAFFPFGGGNRVCIGEGFARMEAVLVLATLLRKWRPEPLLPRLPEPHARITLRPAGGYPVRLQAVSTGSALAR